MGKSAPSDVDDLKPSVRIGSIQFEFGSQLGKMVNFLNPSCFEFIPLRIAESEPWRQLHTTKDH